MKSVLVLLSTYNGEKFLSDQINSLLAQEGVNVHILVRDDGSKDKTLEILEEYSIANRNITILKGQNVGASKSFHILICEAYQNYRNFDYYSFCDQDDVWHRDKLLSACTSLDSDSHLTKLYFCRATPVDANLNIIDGMQDIKIINNSAACIVSNRSLGCCQVFNIDLLDKISILSKKITTGRTDFIPLHDCWTANVAYAFTGTVCFDNSVHIYYRQHGGNVVGAKTSTLQRISRSLYPKYPNFKTDLCREILNEFGEQLPKRNRSLYLKVANYRTGILDTLKFLFTPSIYVFGIKNNLLLVCQILLRRF